ncbi:CD27 antigen isoform X3 [Electrophorus electricus]|uniref:CD27 antigen isoform X3 n=1 Tax=Electrophorus electricus TaxID=8005 RepID=UPI0015D0008F|nr:CD27 antigen isoform X3 [Electrophorus electricus]
MKPSTKMVFLWYGLLLSTHLLSFVQSLECDQDRQYKWPKEKSIKCCDKCKPGQYMTDRCNEGSTTMCKQCPDESYIDFYNNELRCKSCTQCPEKHMVYKENCTKKGDAKCGCESGYELDGMECKKILTTLATPSTTTKTTQQQIPSPTRDTHLHVDGSCRHQLIAFGLARIVQPCRASAQKRRKCRCRSRRRVERHIGRKRSKRDGRVRREEGRRLHMKVWIEYGL